MKDDSKKEPSEEARRAAELTLETYDEAHRCFLCHQLGGTEPQVVMGPIPGFAGGFRYFHPKCGGL